MITPGLIPRLNAVLSGRYHVERELGEGGMADVFVARDLKHDRRVALKVLKAEVAASIGVQRFLSEIKTTARLQHPNILPLFDSGEADGLLFYVTPYIRGESLRRRLARDIHLPVDEALRMASDMTEALSAAHAQGVVHRDIKPANILLSNGRALIADFGVSLALSAAGGGTSTGSGVTIGTPKYMSPEQASGEHPVDERSDVYSVAATLYEMLAGEPPYPGPTAQVVFAKRLSQPVPSVKQLRDAVPASVDRAIRHALQVNPADRTQSTSELLEELSERERDVVGIAWKRGAVAVGLVTLLMAAALLRPENDASEGVLVHERHPIAVMPMETVSDDEETAYLAEGMTDEIRHQLGKISALRVSSGGAVNRILSRSPRLEEIGESLGVEAVLQGSVRQAGSRIRVTVQLVDTRSGRSVWSAEYEDAVENVFDVQRAVALDIAGTLEGALTEDEARRLGKAPTQSLAAYAVYDRARRASAANPERVRLRLQLFETAISMDSTFAEAWAWLSEGHFRMGVYTQDRAVLDRGTSLARHAIELDPDSEMAHLALAQNLWFMGRLGESRIAFLRSLDLNPSFFDASDIALLMNLMGSHDEALYWAERFHALDPNSGFTKWRLARPLIELGAAVEAQEVLSDALAASPGSSRLRGAQMALEASQGRSSAAIQLAHELLADYPNSQEVALNAPDLLQILGDGGAASELERLVASTPDGRMFISGRTVRTAHAFELLNSGEPDQAEEAFQQSSFSALEALESGDERWYVPYELASIAALRGHDEAALDRLEQAYEAGFTRAWLLLRDPMLESLRSEDRFLDLVDRIQQRVDAMRAVALPRSSFGAEASVR